MLDVKFYATVDDALLKFAVIISQSNGKWVFCKHKERDTYEVPGGHREEGEDILETAKRELQEETGAVKFDIEPICVYSVTGKTRVNETGEESFGLLCFAEIMEFSGKQECEIEKVEFMDELPDNWTYPLIQPKLMEEWRRRQSWGDIDCSKDWKTIQKITKGWSTDTKYSPDRVRLYCCVWQTLVSMTKRKRSLILLRSIRKQGFLCQCQLNLAYAIRIKVYI